MKQKFNHIYILSISFISALGGYLFGFDFAVISGALPFLRTTFSLTPWWEGFLTGSLAIGCIVGCIIAGKISDRYGRRSGLMLAALIFTVSSIGMAFSNTLFTFIAMRTLAGVSVGMASVLSPMYIAEISPAEKRGTNVAINQLTIVLGILVTNLVNYTLSGYGDEAWRWMFGLGAVPSLLFLFGLIWLPESPRWLILNGQRDKALKILTKIGGETFADTTLQTISSATGQHQASAQSYAAVFKKGVRPAVYIGITLAVLQQFCGINVVFNYTSTVFEAVGADLDRQLFETVAIGAVNLIFTLLAMWQVDKLGRRPLMLTGSIGLAVMYVILASFLMIGVSPAILSVFILLAIAIYATTLAPVFWVLISEIFPNHVRGKATSVAVIALWIAYFILVFTFPILAKSIGTYGPFYIYAAICLGCFFFVKKKVPETKGKTLENIEQTFSGH